MLGALSWLNEVDNHYLVEPLGRYSNWACWTDLVLRLGQFRQAGRPEASAGRGLVRRLSEGQVAKLIDGYLHGVTMKELASYFKIHRTTVSLHLKRQGVRSRRRS